MYENSWNKERIKRRMAVRAMATVVVRLPEKTSEMKVSRKGREVLCMVGVKKRKERGG